MRPSHGPCFRAAQTPHRLAVTSVHRKLFGMTENAAKRSLCPVRVSGSVVVFTCTRCAWILRVKGDEPTSVGQAAFDKHHCEDFLGDEGI
jgi:hypothetical protein